MLLLSLVSVVCIVSTADAWSFMGYGTTCGKWDREDAITCMAKYVDTDHDNVISRKELSAARKRYGGKLLQFASWAASWVHIDVSTKKVLADCDFNHDGQFTPSDFRSATKTCLPTQASLCMLKKACDRAAGMAKEK